MAPPGSCPYPGTKLEISILVADTNVSGNQSTTTKFQAPQCKFSAASLSEFNRVQSFRLTASSAIVDAISSAAAIKEK